MAFPLLRVALVAGLLTSAAAGADAPAARLTQVFADVKLQRSGTPPRRAVAGDALGAGDILRTAVRSRTEFRLSDATIVRAGAATVLTPGTGTREILLQEGTLFVQVPARFFSLGSRIRCAGIVAVGDGTTFLIEHTPPSTALVNGKRTPTKGYVKAIVLRGTLRVALHGRLGESTLLEPGQMIILDPAAKDLPATVDVDITRLAATTLLVDPAKWGGSATDVTPGIAEQRALKKDGTLIETNLSIFGRGTSVMIKPPTPAEADAAARAQTTPSAPARGGG